MMNKLLSLLDYTKVISPSDVVTHSQVIAEELIRNWKIKSFGQERAFLGLEFYIYIPEIFEDTAVHQRREQLETGTFYFHTKSKGEKWSPPIFNRHGVDITCGNKDRKIHGGILLRHLGGEGHTDGSGYALRSIMRGDEGFKKIPHGLGLNTWTDSEKEFFKRFNNHAIVGGEIELVWRPGHYSGKITSHERIGIENKSHAKEKLRFVASF